MSKPDRLYVGVKMRTLLKQMKDANYLNAENATWKEFFLYAMALGRKHPTDIDGALDGLFLAKDMAVADEALIYACFTNDEAKVDLLADHKEVYQYAQRCANTGFEIIKSNMAGNPENLEKRLLLELDEKYEALKDKSMKSN